MDEESIARFGLLNQSGDFIEPFGKRDFGQMHCILNKLERLMAGLEETDRLDDATIVINGDHGSRISESLYVDYMNDGDLVANYAALFAVRARISRDSAIGSIGFSINSTSSCGIGLTAGISCPAIQYPICSIMK